MSISTYDELTKDYNLKVKELRASCKHLELTDWIRQWPTNYLHTLEIKYCQKCSIAIHERATCWECNRIIEDDEIKRQDSTMPDFGFYCADCFEKKREIYKKNPDWRPIL